MTKKELRKRRRICKIIKRLCAASIIYTIITISRCDNGDLPYTQGWITLLVFGIIAGIGLFVYDRNEVDDEYDE